MAETAKRTRAKKGEGKAVQRTTYVVLQLQGDGAWRPFTDDEATSVVQAGGGIAAIKKVTRQPDGSHAGGIFKAQPLSAWQSANNNLEIETETKTVSSFKTPTLSTNGASPA